MKGLRFQRRALSYETIFGHDLARESSAGTNVTVESARRSMAVWACQSLVSGDLANLPFQPFVKSGEIRLPLKPEPSWIDEPNPLNPNYTDISYKRQLALSLLQDGNAFVFAAPDVDSATQLLVLNPAQVNIKDGDGMPTYEVVGSDKRTVLGLYSPLQIIHIPFILPPGATRGLNPIEAARQGITIDLTAQQQGVKFLDGGGLVTGVIEIPAAAGELNQTQIDDLREAFKRRREGPKGYSIGVLQGGASFKQVSMSQADAQYIETRKYQLEEIARLYLIPPFMVGSQEASGVAYASSVERSQHYIDHCLAHYAGPIERGHRRLLPGPDTYMKFNFNALLRGDTKARYEAYGVALDKKFMVLDEVRAKEELTPFPEGEGGFLETPNNNAPDPRFEAVGALIRAGFDPAESLAAVGLPPITHTGKLPVTVQAEQKPAPAQEPAA